MFPRPVYDLHGAPRAVARIRAHRQRVGGRLHLLPPGDDLLVSVHQYALEYSASARVAHPTHKAPLRIGARREPRQFTRFELALTRSALAPTTDLHGAARSVARIGAHRQCVRSRLVSTPRHDPPLVLRHRLTPGEQVADLDLCGVEDRGFNKQHPVALVKPRACIRFGQFVNGVDAELFGRAGASAILAGTDCQRFAALSEIPPLTDCFNPPCVIRDLLGLERVKLIRNERIDLDADLIQFQ